MQEGCRYKHEIPPDDETRLAIGVRTYPTWPREDPTPPPRPAKAWQGQKPALQQSWRRQDGRGPQAELLGLHKGVDRPDVPSTPAPSSTRSQSGSSQPIRNGSKPLLHTAMPTTPQPATSASHVSRQQSHGQASTSGLINGKGSFQAAAPTAAESFNRQSTHIASHATCNQSASTGANAFQPSLSRQPFTSRPAPTMQASNKNTQATVPPPTKGSPSTQHASHISYAQINSNGLSNKSLGYQFGHTAGDKKTGPTDRFSFGTKGLTKTSGPSIETARSTNAPPYMPTHIQDGQSKGAQTNYPPTLSYDNHSFATSSSTRGNTSVITHGNDPTSSSSRINTPTTTNSNAANPSQNTSSVNDNVHPTVSSDIRTHATANINGHSHGKRKSDGLSFFDSKDSLRAQTPGSVNGSVFGKSNAKFQNPFSPAPCSPQPFHRRMFCEPGQAEYVANSIEDVHTKPQRTIKKHSNGSVHGKGKPHGGKAPHAGKGVNHGNGQTQARPQAESLLV